MAADERIETIGQALKGVFSDPAWLKKCAIGVLVSMIPYVGAVWLMGYGLHYQRGIAWQTNDRLPEWKPAEPHLKTGLYAFVVGVAYSLPLSLVLSVLLVGGIAAGTIGLAADGDAGWLIAAIGGYFVALMLLSVIYSIVLWPAYVHVQLHDSIVVGFEFKRIFGLAKEHGRAYWTAARRSLVITALSVMLVMLGAALATGGVFLVTSRVLPEAAITLTGMLAIPVQIIITGVLGFVAVQLGLAVDRLWAGYARVAYRLGESSAITPEASAAPVATVQGAEA